jgi:hypothetical protein
MADFSAVARHNGEEVYAWAKRVQQAASSLDSVVTIEERARIVFDKAKAEFTEDEWGRITTYPDYRTALEGDLAALLPHLAAERAGIFNKFALEDSKDTRLRLLLRKRSELHGKVTTSGAHTHAETRGRGRKRNKGDRAAAPTDPTAGLAPRVTTRSASKKSSAPSSAPTPAAATAATRGTATKKPRISNDTRPICPNCKRPGHTKERCYHLIGFPDSRGPPKGPGGGRARTAAPATTTPASVLTIFAHDAVDYPNGWTAIPPEDLLLDGPRPCHMAEAWVTVATGVHGTTLTSVRACVDTGAERTILREGTLSEAYPKWNCGENALLGLGQVPLQGSYWISLPILIPSSKKYIIWPTQVVGGNAFPTRLNMVLGAQLLRHLHVDVDFHLYAPRPYPLRTFATVEHAASSHH